MSETNQINNSYPLENITKPSTNDVMLGRGAGTNKHPGNKYFRNVVKAHQDVYLAAKNNFEKYLTTMEILKTIRSLNPPGRFILRDSSSKLWNDVGEEKARRKISQALRENACEIRKNSGNSSTRNLDCSKMTQNDDFKSQHPLERNNSINLNTSQQSIDGSSNKSMELSLSELGILLQDFKPPAGSRRRGNQTTGQDCMIDMETSIGTFTIGTDMSSSFGNISAQMESYPVY